jgi:hypothetical protein
VTNVTPCGATTHSPEPLNRCDAINPYRAEAGHSKFREERRRRGACGSEWGDLSAEWLGTAKQASQEVSDTLRGSMQISLGRFPLISCPRWTHSGAAAYASLHTAAPFPSIMEIRDANGLALGSNCLISGPGGYPPCDPGLEGNGVDLLCLRLPSQDIIGCSASST